MINHVRTLLLNEPGERIPAGAHRSEAYIPLFKPVVLDTPLMKVYEVLYGTDPDYEGKLFRTAQYMAILHSTEFVEYVTALDPRITYDPLRPNLFDQSYGTTVATSGAATLTVLGVWQEPAFKGRMRSDWVVTLAGSQMTARHVQSGYEYTQLLTFTPAGASERFHLPKCDLDALITQAAPVVSQRWDILQRVPVSEDLGEVLTRLDDMSGASQRALLGVDSAEPYVSFRNMFETGRTLPFRMSGVLLALAYRMEALRTP